MIVKTIRIRFVLGQCEIYYWNINGRTRNEKKFTEWVVNRTGTGMIKSCWGHPQTPVALDLSDWFRRMKHVFFKRKRKPRPIWQTERRAQSTSFRSFSFSQSNGNASRVRDANLSFVSFLVSLQDGKKVKKKSPEKKIRRDDDESFLLAILAFFFRFQAKQKRGRERKAAVAVVTEEEKEKRENGRINH